MKAARLARTACALALLALTPATSYAEKRAQISVVFTRDAAPYRDALRGFVEVLSGSGRPYEIHSVYLDGALSADKVIERARERRPDLILTLGSGAMAQVTDRVRDVPIVFSLVLPASGTDAMRRGPERTPNLTGASMEIPLEVQFREFRAVLPAARRLGVLYDPAVTGPMVERAVAAARSAGLELVPMEVKSERDIAGHSERMSGLDALWSVADSTVFSPQGLNQVLLTTLRHQVPFVGLSPSFVKAGALLALSVDYVDVGRQSGELALRVLDGESPANVRITVPRKVSLTLNMNTARQIEVPLDPAVIRKAEVYQR